MRRIKEGDYVRIRFMYNNALVARILKVKEKDPCYHNMRMYLIDRSVKHSGCSYASNRIYEEDIIKYNSKLIEIVEEDDLVNGEVVSKIKNKEEKYIVTDHLNIYKENDIEDILTHEQIERGVYKVKRN